MREGSHAPLLLADSLLSVPALEEDLLRVRVKEANHAEVCDNLSPGNVQLYRKGLTSVLAVRRVKQSDADYCDSWEN